MVAARPFYAGLTCSILGISSAFQFQHAYLSTRRVGIRKEAAIFNSASDVEEYIAANYPACSALLAKNADVMKKIIKADVGFTIFAPNSDAFAALGEKRRSQLEDIRNAEVCVHHPPWSEIILLALNITLSYHATGCREDCFLSYHR